MKMKGVLIKGVLPVVILVAGLLVMRTLIANRPAPEKRVRENPGALVQTVPAVVHERQATITSSGTVQPGQEVTVSLQVSGRITQVAPGFVAGGFFRAGELLFGVESIDYELAVERAKADVAKARTEITVLESRARIARQEWDRLNAKSDLEPNPLVLYEPQLEDAKANLAATLAALKQAELDLSRTRIKAPFNCRVRSEQVGLGQYVKAGSDVALLASVDTAEIYVPLPLDEIPWVMLPGRQGGESASKATVRVTIANRIYHWPGRVDRSLGEVDPQSRMARVVVVVDNPYMHTRQGKADTVDLEVGMFVELAIHGKTMENIVVLPRKVLHDNSTVWVMDNDQKLRIRKVEVVRFEKDDVWIGTGLAEGDRVVLTMLTGAADGMKLRPAAMGDR
jgi:RND family efflux transporter MFP subunit